MSGLLIDLLLGLILIWYARIGYQRGLAIGVLSLFGFVLGAYLAVRFVPDLLNGRVTGMTRSIVLIVAVVGGAGLGQFLGSLTGSRLAALVRQAGLGRADRVLGALASLVATALMMWFVADAARGSAPPGLARSMASSAVLRTIDGLVPTPLDTAAATFRNRIIGSATPRVFEDLIPEPLQHVAAPDISSLDASAQATLRRTTVKITGDAASCGRAQEGSGAVIAKERVITNAHVVAGVRRPEVTLAGGSRTYQASVVLFDPVMDVAVLRVPGLTVAPLSFGEDLERGDAAAVAGFPENGPYSVQPARVRSQLSARGQDIYGSAGAVRSVYSLYVSVRQGNSGGPVVNAAGQFVGLVFARSLDDSQTGYALTLSEIKGKISSGSTATERVSTGACTSA